MSGKLEQPPARLLIPLLSKVDLLQAAAPAIRIEGLVKTFPSRSGFVMPWKHNPRKKILDNINLTVQKGELLALLGPNGAGKTTLIQILATLALPDEGVVEVAGRSVASDSDYIKKNIALCSSADRGFYYRLSARNNLRFFGGLADLYGQRLNSRIDEVLDFVDLRQDADVTYARYSTGMRQRLSIARALLNDADILLLDEPTRGVDPVHAEALRMLIRNKLVRDYGKTIILATNILEEAWQLASRIVILKAGKIVAVETPQELQNSAQDLHRYSVVMNFADDLLIQRTREVQGVLTVAVQQVTGGTELSIAMAHSENSLTDVLRALTADGAKVRSVAPELATPGAVFAAIMERDDA
ncbi:MAG: ABC transporter ATP-binding protein [Candidatus Eremiobacteraeota bacterium]|nr:ABC transporter ATP-binding protein [Candidatus Eremiobacteraeota bacterium]MDQ6932467.1 ABC transporter ATP-binding protein [Candidatus Eremiobacteraeota bacterium]